MNSVVPGSNLGHTYPCHYGSNDKTCHVVPLFQGYLSYIHETLIYWIYGIGAGFLHSLTTNLSKKRYKYLYFSNQKCHFSSWLHVDWKTLLIVP